jgi:recombination protein RecR
MPTRFAAPMADLIDELRKLPGVGTKSAQRFAFHILRSPGAEAAALAAAILALKQHLRLCSVCNNITDIDPCAYCTSAARNSFIICVVEEPTNIASIERTRNYNGLYHILHGTLSPVNGVGPDQLRLANLYPRLAGLTELILATSPTVEGEATARYIVDAIRQAHPPGLSTLRITRIATGVPAGSDIEYADEVTMTRSLENRREL